jgi:hypothetical protein
MSSWVQDALGARVEARFFCDSIWEGVPENCEGVYFTGSLLFFLLGKYVMMCLDEAREKRPGIGDLLNCFVGILFCFVMSASSCF